jgi:hypothetical protein
MNTYRNVKTGVTVRIQGEAKGDWELVPAPASEPVKAPETPKTEPKKRKATKKK